MYLCKRHLTIINTNNNCQAVQIVAENAERTARSEKKSKAQWRRHKNINNNKIIYRQNEKRLEK